MTTRYTDEIRTCIRDKCDRTFRVKVKGRHQIYCSTSCRTLEYQQGLPIEVRRKWWKAHYWRNPEARRAQAREYKRMRCECGQRKESPDDAMCASCKAIGPIGRVL